MDPDKIHEYKIQELIDKLNYYTKYYDMGQSLISDKEWDDMYFGLQQLENYYGIYLPDSPTQRVNYQVVNKLNKVTHNHPMLSLDKTKSIDDIKSFIGNNDYIAMAKMDGLTCSLRYVDGRLVSAETRGNGVEGEDILHNILQIKNVPKKINWKHELIVDGEVICTYENFKSFEKEYKNPRNFASGSIRLLDSKESASRNLTFVAWDCIKGLEYLQYLTVKLKRLMDFGFTIVPYEFEDNYNSLEVEDAIEKIKATCKILSYPIDGIVFKYDDCNDYEAAGRTDHHFKGGLAYKFYDEEYETTLLDIEWTMGRTGLLTPVAIYKDIDIEGTICNRASLHNISVIRDLFNGTPKKGQKIWIYKSNMIIPQISKVEQYNENEIVPIESLLIPPEYCPICGHATELFGDNSSIFLRCGNPSCEGLLLNRIEHFFSKRSGINAKGLSKATIEKLIDWGWVNSVLDMFKLDKYQKEWISKSGFGEKSVTNILQAIKDSCNCDLESIISAAGIPLIGRAVARDIVKKFSTYKEFREATENDFDFSTIEGFGYEMNKSLKTFNYIELDYIVENYLTINNKVEENKEQKLEGKTFCITGKLTKEHWKNRDELSSFITSLGGKVVSAMSPNVDYLINNDTESTSAKNLKAKELGKSIIDEQMFIDMFDLQKNF